MHNTSTRNDARPNKGGKAGGGGGRGGGGGGAAGGGDGGGGGAVSRSTNACSALTASLYEILTSFRTTFAATYRASSRRRERAINPRGTLSHRDRSSPGSTALTSSSSHRQQLCAQLQTSRPRTLGGGRREGCGSRSFSANSIASVRSQACQHQVPCHRRLLFAFGRLGPRRCLRSCGGPASRFCFSQKACRGAPTQQPGPFHSCRQTSVRALLREKLAQSWRKARPRAKPPRRARGRVTCCTWQSSLVGSPPRSALRERRTGLGSHRECGRSLLARTHGRGRDLRTVRRTAGVWSVARPTWLWRHGLFITVGIPISHATWRSKSIADWRWRGRGGTGARGVRWAFARFVRFSS